MIVLYADFENIDSLVVLGILLLTILNSLFNFPLKNWMWKLLSVSINKIFDLLPQLDFELRLDDPD